MTVLILIKDLFSSTGGGQTVYKKIIELNPSINFFYFIEKENRKTFRPFNATPIKLGSNLFNNRLKFNGDFISDPQLSILVRYADSVRNMEFDFIEFPDYLNFGNYYKAIFSYFNVKSKAFVLSLHGRSSLSSYLNWDVRNGGNDLGLNSGELSQYILADFVYGISPNYIDFYKSQYDKKIYQYDPLLTIDVNLSQLNSSQNRSKPNLYCIGRTERIKGHDIFIELVRNLEFNNFGDVFIAGEEDFSNYGISSIDILRDYATFRNIDFTYLNEVNKFRLKEIYEGNSVLILPVRNDSFNLVALEAIFSGCLVVISDRAGICDYLDKNFLGITYLKINIEDLSSASIKINSFLENADVNRKDLLLYLNNLEVKLESRTGGLYTEFYNDLNYVNHTNDLMALELESASFNFKYFLAKTFSFLFSRRTYNILLSARKNLGYFLKYYIKKSNYLELSARIYDIIDSINIIINLKKNASIFKESKLGSYNNKFFRYSYWHSLYHFYRNKANDNTILSLVYGIRCHRFNENCEIPVEIISKDLKINNYTLEAEVFSNMYSSDSENLVYDYLIRKFEQLKNPKIKDLLIVDDFRQISVPKVSIIVSMYNAESKLYAFLSSISRQTYFKESDSYEIILVDSGSPTNEYKVFKEFCNVNKLNLLYVKSTQRETIQSAWNSGVKISRGKYLVFLGVDETLYPDALELLSNYLENDESIDWVMANSIVNEINHKGEHLYDSLIYDRSNATKESVYLDTCYISWVGGMYRRDIHERFGYYDETFRAAGDTEFKNRVLKHLNVKYINKSLGVFLNYPEERATSSYSAEIEDLRAWYVFKYTQGGIKYLFENYSQNDIEEVYFNSISFRRSFSKEVSTDFNYTVKLGEFINRNFKFNERIDIINKDLIRLNEIIFKIDVGNPPNSFLMYFYPFWILISSFYFELKHRIIFKFRGQINYRIFNDLRYLQHYWIWK